MLQKSTVRSLGPLRTVRHRPVPARPRRLCRGRPWRDDAGGRHRRRGNPAADSGNVEFAGECAGRVRHRPLRRGPIARRNDKAERAPWPIPEVQALVGLVGHPTPTVDLYAYVGTEQEAKTAFTADGKGYGYGSPLFVDSGCDVELSPLACTATHLALPRGPSGHGGAFCMAIMARWSWAGPSR